MNSRSKGFTLAELLTVLAIIIVVAGVMFPVFASARATARRTVCVSNLHQVHIAVEQYMGDYDGYFMPVNYRPATPGDPRNDKTWVQMTLPYARNFSVYTCPSDTGVREKMAPPVDPDLTPGDIYEQYYTASLHVNTGYNYMYLAPIVYKHNQWLSMPRLQSDIAEPSKTLLFVDSVWDRFRNGQPFGGGNWLVVPPCRYQGNGPSRVDTFLTDGLIYSPFMGWKTADPYSSKRYGNVWAWHLGRVNMIRVDGSVSSLTMDQVTSGCSVQDGWRGNINDPDSYIWDMR